jgi:hypothetical protein
MEQEFPRPQQPRYHGADNRRERYKDRQMPIGGLFARASLLKEQMKKKPCKRCGLLYDPKKEDQCPYCGDLDEAGLASLLERRETEYRANRQLGFRFILAAVFILLIITMVGLS